MLLQGLLTCPGSHAEPAPPPAAQQWLALLNDPALRDWLQQELARPRDAAAGNATVQAATVQDPTVQDQVQLGLQSVRTNLAGRLAALPLLPGELARASGVMRAELKGYGPIKVVLLVLVFAALGYASNRLFWRATRGWRQRTIASRLDSIGERFWMILHRLAFGTLNGLSFALGSIGAFLLFPWPPLLGQLIVSLLFIVVGVQIGTILGRLTLAPGAPRFRILPVSQVSADYWFFWLRLLGGYIAAEIVLAGFLVSLGMSEPVRALIVLAWALGGMVLVQIALFRRPAHRAGRPGARARTRLVAALLVLGMAGRVAGFPGLFVLVLAGVGVPAALVVTRQAVAHLLRPPGSETVGDAPPTLFAAGLERGLQVLILLLGLTAVAAALGLQLSTLSSGDRPIARFAGRGIDAAIILLLANFGWHLARTWIDRKLYEVGYRRDAVSGDAEGGTSQVQDLAPDEARRRARILTLLPIVRNVGFVVLSVMACLMALSALGVEVGPLLAGAGVVGVAVGFGAQTLVRDIISGMFYLLDDAFRVGEYIVSGSYKGTVESFSLRSIKLRHHRGPLFTVPFGQLGAVQNLSRDWVIDKLQVGVTYDTDMALVRKVVKQVGQELMADAQLAPSILEPLKSQGVYAMGDYAIQLRMKMKTRPGEQFAVRRVAYDKIKRAFEANGIRFAFPTVTVAGGDAAAPVIAQQGLALIKEADAA